MIFPCSGIVNAGINHDTILEIISIRSFLSSVIFKQAGETVSPLIVQNRVSFIAGSFRLICGYHHNLGLQETLMDHTFLTKFAYDQVTL